MFSSCLSRLLFWCERGRVHATATTEKLFFVLDNLFSFAVHFAYTVTADDFFYFCESEENRFHISCAENRHLPIPIHLTQSGNLGCDTFNWLNFKADAFGEIFATHFYGYDYGASLFCVAFTNTLKLSRFFFGN